LLLGWGDLGVGDKEMEASFYLSQASL